jgi:hypothetical protein
MKCIDNIGIVFDLLLCEKSWDDKFFFELCIFGVSQMDEKILGGCSSLEEFQGRYQTLQQFVLM